VPDEALAKALILAAHRGGDVRVLVPRRSNRRIADAAARPYLRALQAAGASILLHTDGMLHAKVVLVAAELAVLGTANMDMRSLLLNYEIAAFVYSRPEIEAIQA
jgi:cardiolipin synthase